LNESVLAENVLRDFTCGLSKCRFVASSTPILDTGSDEFLPDPSSCELSVNRQHEQMKPFAATNGHFLSELPIK
jgi:hypothetical protein